MRRTIFSLLINLVILNVNAQIVSYHPPLDIPLYLSGNFAELRSNHFHSGIDIKTQGVIGKKVYAIDDGYVSRIKVQTNGYGNSIYINHPGGITSVYGHLSKYNAEISEYVKKYQYENHTHTLNIYPDRDEFKIKKGEIIAYSGNTGGSAGPHLHFELRNSGNQHPLNVLNYDFLIKDNISPKLYSLYLYNIENKDNRRRISSQKKFPLIKNDTDYFLTGESPLVCGSNIGFGIQCFDFLNNSHNRCGIYTIELFMDEELIYLFKTDEFSFSESKYINSHIDYLLKQEEKLLVHRLFTLPNSSLSMVKVANENGIIHTEAGGIYHLKLVIKDVSGNASILNFTIKGKPENNFAEHRKDKVELFRWDEENDINNHLFKLNIPPNSLYQDNYISYSRIQGGTNLHKWTHNIGDPDIPLHKGAFLYLNTETIDGDLRDKLCVIKKNKDNDWVYSGGELSDNNWIKAKINEFGSYSIGIDTLAPTAKLVSSKNVLKFKIQDDLSGIGKYEAYIDNEWALFEYDIKNDLLVYKYDKNRINSNTKHELELYLVDNKNNTFLFHSTFYW